MKRNKSLASSPSSTPVKGQSKDLGHIDSLTKACILFSIIGPASTKKILAHLPDVLTRKIVSQMNKISAIPHEVANAVMKEYEAQLSERHEIIFDAKQTLQYLQSFLNIDIRESLENQESTRQKIQDILLTFDDRDLITVLQREHYQTATLIFYFVATEKKSQVFPQLPAELQTEILLRMAKMDTVEPENLHELFHLLEMEHTPSVHFAKKGGIKEAAKLINEMPEEMQQSILKTLNERGPATHDQIKNEMFTFEDIIKIDDRSWMVILKEIALDAWPLALKNMPEGFREAIYSHMSSRMAKTIKEDLADLPKVPLKDVKKRQDEILKKLEVLKNKGSIEFNGNGQKKILGFESFL